ncbi:hypothetical protein QBC41DRAFT_390427 [Cercophora samala]|uniref:Uncharacterized protein n=1 Tax=Cercophora samala TaxID=330535 RepID=A0AA40DBA1_9PEZI|nr:hypothetical protein QBC41DRAFT_390427 [Cercophora samala]
MENLSCLSNSSRRHHPASTSSPLPAIHGEIENHHSRTGSNDEATSRGTASDQKVPVIALQPPSTPEVQAPGTTISNMYPKRGYIMDELKLQRPINDQHGLQDVDVSKPKNGQLVTYFRVGDREDDGIDLLIPFEKIAQYVSAREREEWKDSPEKIEAINRIMEKERRKLQRIMKAGPKNVFLEDIKLPEAPGRSVTRSLARTMRHFAKEAGLDGDENI